MSRPELRVDPIRGWETIVAPGRARRPFDSWRAPAPDLREADCPFCPGAEDQLGRILAETPSLRPGQPWGTRAVLNRYAFLGTGGADPTVEGAQEVLIDGPAHHLDPADQSRDERRAVVRMWRDRVAAARTGGGGEVHLFRNHGRDAGSSRRHPHAQLVRTASVTPARRAMLERLDAAGGAGCCLLCTDSSPDADSRAVVESPLWRVWTLYAPLDPCHMRIAPRRHVHSLTALDEAELDGLADLLGSLPRAIERASGAVSWSLLVHDLSGRGPGRHLHLELRPRLTRLAGFEQSSGIGVCPSDPAEDAAALRAAVEVPADSGHPSSDRHFEPQPPAPS